MPLIRIMALIFYNSPMTDQIHMILTFAGGVALFLLGMKLLTDGLKLAAGDSLRNLLSRFTSTVFKGVLSGILVTAFVQSSSAVIFATIGFVNAGVMTLGQAIFVIFGSNVGTTFTGWIIASVGLKIDLQLLSMPLVSVGMALWLLKGNRIGAWGQAMVGLSLFFMGIDILKTTFSDLGEIIPLDSIGTGFTGTLWMLLAGVFLTVVMQSSSAAIAVVITAVAGGVIPIQMAAFMVIGADIGTTSTAAFAVLGATSNAKRTASAHVIFNVVGGTLIFFLVPYYLYAIDYVWQSSLSAEVTIALFHTMKKMSTLFVLIPFVGAIEKRLNKLFIEKTDDQSRPKYLDNMVLQTPSLAISAIIFELKRIGRKSRQLIYQSISGTHTHSEIKKKTTIVEQLHLNIAEYIPRIQGSGLPSDKEYAMPQALRVLEYFREAVLLAEEYQKIELPEKISETLRVSISKIEADLLTICLRADSEIDSFSLDEVKELQEKLLVDYESFKIVMLTESARSQIPLQSMLTLHDRIRILKSITDQLVKAAIYMDDFNKLIEHNPVDHITGDSYIHENGQRTTISESKRL